MEGSEQLAAAGPAKEELPALVLRSPDFRFSAAHLAAVPGSLGRLRGHSFEAELRLSGWRLRESGSEGLEDAQQVLAEECSRLHERVLLPEHSDLLKVAPTGGQVVVVCDDGSRFSLPGADCLLLPIARATLEELAALLWGRLAERCSHSLCAAGVDVLRVAVWEGPLRSASFGKALQPEAPGPRAPPERAPAPAPWRAPLPPAPPRRAAPRRYVLLTGASRGYGRALATALAAEAEATQQPVHLVLLARDEAGLRETAQAARGNSVSHHCAAIDLSSPSRLAERLGPVLDHLEAALARRTPAPAELLVLHNAGSLGPLLYCGDFAASDAQLALDLNVTSFAVLTNAVLGRFAPAASATGAGPGGLRVRVVNISSLLAAEAFPAFSLYSMGKAARDMAMRSIAREAEVRGLDVRTLSWAPGPMRSAMVDQIMGTCADPGVLESFKKMDREDSFVPMEASAEKLLKLLAEESYESGAHVDFFDA